MSEGEKSAGSMSDGSESESEISSMRALRDMLGTRLTSRGIAGTLLTKTSQEAGQMSSQMHFGLRGKFREVHGKPI